MLGNANDNPCNGLAENSEAYIESLYKSCFHQVRGMILQNSGTVDDARDVFQEAVMVYYQKCREDNFKLTSNVCTYLFSIARNKWLKELSRSKKVERNENAINMAVDKVSFDDDLIMQQQRLLSFYLTKLCEKCQNIIQLYFEGMDGESIAKQLQFSSYEYYRLAKKRCIDGLKEMMHKDRLFKELKN